MKVLVAGYGSSGRRHVRDLMDDLAEHLLGPPGTPLLACVARVSDLTVDAEDVAELVYRSVTGAIVSVHLDCLWPGYRRGCWIVGDTGAIEVDLAQAAVRVRGRDSAVTRSWDGAPFGRNDTYVAVLDDFFAEIDGRNADPVLPSFREGASVMRTALTARAAYTHA